MYTPTSISRTRSLSIIALTRARICIFTTIRLNDGLDAFNGYLDHAMLTNTYKHSNLFTIDVEGGKHGATPPRPADHSHWHLPAFGLSHEHKYLYKIHTLDLYLWTANDSMKFTTPRA
ncbi:hypothetical protein KCU76_g59, partial [Aureobasidium melanogenum]